MDPTSAAPAYPAPDPSSATAPYPMFQLLTDVLHYLIESITDPEQLRTLSSVNKCARALVRSLHCPLTIKLPFSDPQQAAEQLCVQAAESQYKRLRVLGDWSVDAGSRSQAREGVWHDSPQDILAQTAVQTALQHITTVELKVSSHTIPSSSFEAMTAGARRASCDDTHGATRFARDVHFCKRCLSANSTQGLALDTLAPSWLHLVGPQVTTLVIKDCYVPQTNTPPPPLPHIHSLQLSNIITSDDPYMSQEVPAMSLQLGVLTGLQELTCTARLTRLLPGRCGLRLWGTVPHRLPECLCGTLQRLDLPNAHFNDAGVEILLSMPALRQVGFERVRLTQDYSQRACQWEQLTCARLQLNQLSRLPLQSVQSLRLHCDTVTQYRMRPERQEGMQLWVEGAFGSSDTVTAAAQMVASIPTVTFVPPTGVQSTARSNTELILVLWQGHLKANEALRGFAAFEALWVALARGLPDSAATVTVQLRDITQCSPEFLHAMTQLLHRSTKPGLNSQIRLELWHRHHMRGSATQLLHVTAGLPLVLTMQPHHAHEVLAALTHAPQDGPLAKLTLQLACKHNKHNLCRPERHLPRAAARAVVDLELVYLHGEMDADVLSVIQWRLITSVFVCWSYSLPKFTMTCRAMRAYNECV